jgi:penicillin-binding protein 2
LETGVFTPDYTYDCQYEFKELDGVTLKDWTLTEFEEDGVTQPSGLLTYPQGLIRSCNPFFWHIGKALYDRGFTTAISDMARGFGLGAKTGIEVVDEEAGNAPDPVSQFDAVNLAIGQGDLQVTPLQVARFVAALGNGGNLLRPQAIEKIISANGQVSNEFKPEIMGTLPISADTLKLIQNAMHDVTVSKNPRGTAYLVFNGFSIPVHGKTGTAETGGADPHAWFAGYTNAQRENKPDIAVVVLAENAGQGSEIAAPIFRRIVEYYFFGQPQKLYPWESGIGITKTPTSLFTETPIPEIYP